MFARVRIREVEHVSGTRVRLRFTNGETREVDLGPYLHGPVFDDVKADPELFQAVSVDSELGTIVWPNGADIDPDVLYENLAPAWREAEQPSTH